MWYFSGSPNSETEEALVDGPFANWNCTNYEEIICNADNQICNPTENLVEIQRCIGGIQGAQCRFQQMLPSVEEVSVAIMEKSYDTPPYNKSNYVEGFREGFTHWRRKLLETEGAGHAQ